MGFDLQRFPNCIDEELICSICGGVLQDPIQAPACEHTFCQKCIEEWLLRSQTCPIDRTAIEIEQFKPVPRILKNLLNRLEISCENRGCQTVLRLEQLSTHLADCQHSPNTPTPCEKGCGMSLSKDERSTHNCLDVLRAELTATQKALEESRTDLLFYKNEVQLLQEFLRTIRSHPPSSGCVAERTENDEILRWSNGLQIARVTHWGGMISTPDVLSREAIRSALLDSHCPSHWTEIFLDKAHERRWPEGLATLETRQENRQHYESYICRRILDKQAVVILSCDNRHMNQSMISEPGLVIIFSHGVK